LALAEIKRAKLRFGLLTGAVALLVFLILFQQTLASALLGSFTGGLEHQSATVLVYNQDARRSIDASRVPPQTVELVAAVPGVAEAGPIGEATFTAEVGSERRDTTVFGYALGGPGQPTTLVEGRLPTTDGEAVASSIDAGKGYGVGRTVIIVPGDTPITIVGLARDAQFNVQPTIYVSFATFETITRMANPAAEAVLPNVVGVEPASGVDPVVLAERITKQVPGIEALDRATAVSSQPGVSSITQSFAIILLLAFIVVLLVTGFFFLILTVQKTQALTLLRAVGASTPYLIGSLALQVALVTVVGIALASILLAFATSGSGTGLEISVSPRLILLTGSGVLLLALLASLAAMRRVVRIEPAAAAARTTGGGLA
jgi:putative ABC transport system permease protein